MICRRCKKFKDKHYGEDLYCYGDSKSKEKFVSYKWKKKSKKKWRIAKNGQEALKLLKKAKKGDTIIWDERTPTTNIRRVFIK